MEIRNIEEGGAAWDEAAGVFRLFVKDHIVIPCNEEAEPRRDIVVPGKEILQLGGVKAFTGISGADEYVGIGRNLQPPVHPVSVGESEDFMAFVLDEHYAEY